MCGIVGAIADRDIVPILIEGLRRLEYRGYDSAGLAILDGSGELRRLRTVGKVRCCRTRSRRRRSRATWASAHYPLGDARRAFRAQRASAHLARRHRDRSQRHHRESRGAARRAQQARLPFTSETDTEVIAHRIHYHKQKLGDLFRAVRATVAELEGAYALAVVSQDSPETIVLGACRLPRRHRCGNNEHFVASDVAALLPVTASSFSSTKATSRRSAARACASSTAKATPHNAL
jgi:glucosamine--fructose-6-phosphate aminotransferase (isomerizing)